MGPFVFYLLLLLLMMMMMMMMMVLLQVFLHQSPFLWVLWFPWMSLSISTAFMAIVALLFCICLHRRP